MTKPQVHVHRADIGLRTVCGLGIIGHKVSVSGAVVTCPRCLERSAPANREEIMAQINKAAARFRATFGPNAVCEEASR